MEKLVLNFIGTDNWSRPVFKSTDGKIFKDTNCGEGKLALCTAYGFEGEPDTPIEYISKYKNLEVEIVGMENEPTKEEKFNYMMLDRLRTDCEYFLNYGNRNTRNLQGESVQKHIAEMKKLYNFFDDDKKPEWLNWEEILEYERKMLG